MQVTRCDICKQASGSKVTHSIKADDDRFVVHVELDSDDSDLDACPDCWWKLVRQAIKEPA